MNNDLLYKIILFWFIFYITPGPVWIAIMESAKHKNIYGIYRLFTQVFLPNNLFVQSSQAVICVLFVNFITTTIDVVDFVLYFVGACYILYLAIKVLVDKQDNKNFEISRRDLTIILLTSPKVWLLFPTGALFAKDLTSVLVMNIFIFSAVMFLISSMMFFLYAIIAKTLHKILRHKFSYISFVLLLFFAIFLFNEFVVTANSKLGFF